MSRRARIHLFLASDPASGVLCPCASEARPESNIRTLRDGCRLEACIDGTLWRLLAFRQSESTARKAAFDALDGNTPTKLMLGPATTIRWPNDKQGDA